MRRMSSKLNRGGENNGSLREARTNEKLRNSSHHRKRYCASRRRAEYDDAVLVDGKGGCRGALCELPIQTTVIDPGKGVTAVGDGTLEDVDLRAEAVLERHDDPAALETVLDLVFVDHVRVAEDEGSAMDREDWS